ncbi:MAG: hypothetical protein GAK29_01758 [Acinetobacter bereziniae]|uniref:Uncharacterized protein n=1 Tax=Acinetobacter bereziniae TaxID=106648 RepID=A0A833UD90_ACIBZ|nr:MAG: hypothetical protein GAK29_01758 [Acinetobacter bereziniae]
MTTFDANTNDQDQTDFVASLDQCENDVFQNDSHFDIYDGSINYVDFNNILDIQERIEFSKVQAYFNEREIDQSQILKLDESLTNIQEKNEFDKINAECNIIVEKDKIADSKFCEFLFNAHWHLATQYVVKNNIGLLKVDEAKDKSIWCGGSCNSSSQSIPDSLDSLELTLSRLKPAKIVYLQSTNYASDMCNDSVFGFGLYLFDEANNLITKMIYKFFDESIAPENARRLNTPTTFEQLDDSSRPFF